MWDVRLSKDRLMIIGDLKIRPERVTKEFKKGYWWDKDANFYIETTIGWIWRKLEVEKLQFVEFQKI